MIFSNDTPAPGKDLTDRKLLEKVKRHVDYFALQAVRQDFMLSKRFADQTIAASIIFAARKASKTVS